MWPSGSEQIHTSSHAGGMASDLIRSTTASSVMRSPLASRYVNPLPARRRRMPGPLQSISCTAMRSALPPPSGCYPGGMKITVTSVLVDDQSKALRFYSDVLGFQPKRDIPLGEYSWLTVVSPEDPEGVELLLEPDEHPAARPFKEALVNDGIPFTSFTVDDVREEYDRLVRLGVHFTQP